MIDIACGAVGFAGIPTCKALRCIYLGLTSTVFTVSGILSALDSNINYTLYFSYYEVYELVGLGDRLLINET